MDIRVIRYKNPSGNLLGKANIQFNAIGIRVDGFKILKGKDGSTWVGWPQSYDKSREEWIPILIPEDRELQKSINEEILLKWQKATPYSKDEAVETKTERESVVPSRPKTEAKQVSENLEDADLPF